MFYNFNMFLKEFCFISLFNKTGDAAFLSSTISLILGTYLGSQISPPPPNVNRS